MASPDRLFTPRFFMMCGFTFTVFVSAFQLLPTAPFHILDLGGTTFASGLFLGFLTYSSALSAPLTGAYADRIGQRRVLIVTSLALALFSVAYAVITDYRLMLALAIVQGIFWSGLLSASAAYMTHMLPERRRAEGIGYWGLSTMAALAVSPTIGFWVYRFGWVWLCVIAGVLNLVMAGIAWSLDEHPAFESEGVDDATRLARVARPRDVADIVPLCVRLWRHHELCRDVRRRERHDTERDLPDGAGDRHALHPTLHRTARRQLGLPARVRSLPGDDQLRPGVPRVGGTRFWMVTSAIIFGIGFGTAYPAYVGYVMQDVTADRRGAAFGAILAAFDTGIGTGSTSMGWLIDRLRLLRGVRRRRRDLSARAAVLLS